MITPDIRVPLLGQLAVTRPTGQLHFDRAVETVIGAGIGGAIVLCEPWLRARVTS